MQYKKIDGYILAKYLKTFLLAMALIIVIVITFDISEKLDDFLGNHAPFREIVFNYYLNFIPGFVNLYSPLFIFISVIFFTSKMAGNTEIIAILGNGISYKRLLRPYLHGASIVALVVLILGNFVIPWSNQFLSEFEGKYIKTMKRSYYSKVHFQPAKNTQIYTESFDVNQSIAFNFSKDVYDENGTLVERYAAESISYDTTDGLWNANAYSHRVIKGKKEKLTFINQGKIDVGLKPEDFQKYHTDIQTLNTPKLIKHIQRESMRGSGAVIVSKIELYQRLLNPLAIIVMSFIGVAISSRKTRGGIGIHLAIGISIAFGFIVFMKVTTVFATNGNLSAFLAVLLPQIVFSIAAAYLIKTAPK